MRLKHRLSLTLTLLTAAALLVGFSASFALVYRDELRDFDEAIRIQAQAEALVVGQKPKDAPIEDGTAEDPDFPRQTRRYVALFSDGGELRFATKTLGANVPNLGSLRLPQGSEDGRTVDFRVGTARVRGIVLSVPERKELLLYALSRRSVDEDLRFLVQVFAALLFVTVAVTALVARWLGGLLASDVDAIAATAERVGAGDLAARVGGAARGSTETRLLGESLDRMIGQLDHLISAQQTFVSHAAHELRSPLTTLRGELQLALRRPRSSAEYEETLKDLLVEVEKLVTLAEDLLLLARVTRSQRPDERFTVGEAVADALRMSRGLADQKAVDLPEAPEAPFELSGSKRDVARALRNLVDNAIEHNPSGGRIRVDVWREGDQAVVSVEDDGRGIAKEDAPHVFSAFYRGAKDRTESAHGSGMGLAITRQIARAYGGDVTLDAEATRGARFLVRLPLAAGHEPPASA